MKYRLILTSGITSAGVALVFRFIERIVQWRMVILMANDKDITNSTLLAGNMLVTSLCLFFSIAFVVIGIGLLLYLYWNMKMQKKENISGLIFVSVASSFMSIVVWPFTFSIIGIILGHISMLKSKLKHPVTNKMIVAALGIGYVSLILSIVYVWMLYPYPVEIQERIGEHILFRYK